MRNNKNNINLNVGNITLNLENIISFFRDLIGHFTDKEKILTLRFRNITLSLLILILSLANITLCFSNYNNTSALDYSSNVGIGFTFNPTLSVNISFNDLIIPNLAPGTTSDSNSINVSIATNAAYGYTLSANVGDDIYNNSNLTHSNNTDVFSSIATNADLASLDDSDESNIWGYSTKLPDETVWSNYNGLPSYIDGEAQLIDTNRPVRDTISFRIAAKASPTQVSGEYANIINFVAVAKPNPQSITDLEYLQDFATISDTDLNNVKESMLLEHNYILKDQRDEQEYTVAKLADNKIWMTKNLNLAGDTILSPDDTDFEPSYILPTTRGWTTANNNLKLVMPESSTNGFSSNNYAYVYNTNNDTSDCSAPGCYSYYSWDTVTLGSGRQIGTDNQNAPYSICPKGWHLPSTYNGVDDSTDFRALMIAYGGSESTQIYDSSIYGKISVGTTPNFLLAHFYYCQDTRTQPGACIFC